MLSLARMAATMASRLGPDDRGALMCGGHGAALLKRKHVGSSTSIQARLCQPTWHPSPRVGVSHRRTGRAGRGHWSTEQNQGSLVC